jgi:hypothetical protein
MAGEGVVMFDPRPVRAGQDFVAGAREPTPLRAPKALRGNDFLSDDAAITNLIV